VVAMGGSGDGRHWQWVAAAHGLSLSTAAILFTSSCALSSLLTFTIQRYPIKILLPNKTTADTPPKF